MRNMPKCKKHVQLVQSPEKMRAGLILIVLEQLTHSRRLRKNKNGQEHSENV